MKLYPENYDVQLEVLFTDSLGQSMTVTAVSAVLFDADDIEIADLGAVTFDSAEGKTKVTVPAEFNVLGEGETAAARSVRIKLETDTTSVFRNVSYIIEAESRLEILNNTFLTLPAAEVLARDNPQLKAWNGATDEKKAAALINAYSRLSRVQLRYLKPKEEIAVPAIRPTPLPYLGYEHHYSDDVVIRPGDWGRRIDKDDFLKMPDDFRKAIRNAQIIEANAVLTDSPYEQRHRAGVISETVGESSIMLRAGKLELGVANETLRALTGFVYYNVRLAR